MKRNYTARRGPPRQRPVDQSSHQSKSGSEDGGKKRAAPSRRGSLLATATRKDVPTEENTHTMPDGRTLGFFDKMLGLRISRAPSSNHKDKDTDKDKDKSLSKGSGGFTTSYYQPNNTTSITTHNNNNNNNPPGPGAGAGLMGPPAPLDLAAKGWAGMPQTNDTKLVAAGMSSGASINSNGGASRGSRGGGGGGGNASSSGGGGGGDGQSSERPHRSGSSSLGSFAALMPWNRSNNTSTSQNSQNSLYLPKSSASHCSHSQPQQQQQQQQHTHTHQQQQPRQHQHQHPSCSSHSHSQQRSLTNTSSAAHPRKSQSGMSSMSFASISDRSMVSGSLADSPRFYHPLYNLVESNKLEVRDLSLPVTAKDLNSVMEATASYVAECMSFYYNVVEMPMPSVEARPRGTIMVSDNWQTASQLMVLVPNHTTASPLGLWSRSLCIEQGLRFGTMLPYVDTAYREGFAVIICNPAQTHGEVSPVSVSSSQGQQQQQQQQGISASASVGGASLLASSSSTHTNIQPQLVTRKVILPIEGASTPEEHMAWIYDNLLTKAEADHVVLVGYSHGARLCKEMLRRSFAYQQDPHHAQDYKPISTIALIESSRLRDPHTDSTTITNFLLHNAVDLKQSQHPIGRPLPDVAASIGVGSCFSLGTTGPDMNLAWSIYQGMGEVFKFCEKRRIPEKRAPRLKISDLMGLMRPGGKKVSSASSAATAAAARAAAEYLAGGGSGAGAAAGGGGGGVGGGGGGGHTHPLPLGASAASISSNSHTHSMTSGGPTLLGNATATTASSVVSGVTSAGMSSAMGGGSTVVTGGGDASVCDAASMDDNHSTFTGVSYTFKRKDSWSSLLDRKECMSVQNFTLERVIGKGAFGKVMMVRVRNDVARRVYAMKVINKSEIIRRGYVESTKLERSILCEADHPFIVHLRFAFQNASKLYLVTDFYNGGNLLVHLKRNYVFAEHVARFFAAEVFLAIQYLHSRHIVYRDLKPENVLMESSGHVALTDFGLSKQLLNHQRTSTFCGTAEYLAPEQLRRAPYGISVDWWAFGIFVYEMLVGRSPFYNRSRTAMYERIVNEDPVFLAEMSPDAVDLISLLLKKGPEQRLGATASDAIKHHPFFRELDWEQLYSKDVTPPINPDIARASDCRYISSRYLTLEPRDTLEGDAGHRFSDFSFIGEDTYHQALSQQRGASTGGRLGTLHSCSDQRESYASGSDATPWTTGSHTSGSAVTVASVKREGVELGGSGSEYFSQVVNGGGGRVSGSGHHFGSVVVPTPPPSAPSSSSSLPPPVLAEPTHRSMLVTTTPKVSPTITHTQTHRHTYTHTHAATATTAAVAASTAPSEVPSLGQAGEMGTTYTTIGSCSSSLSGGSVGTGAGVGVGVCTNMGPPPAVSVSSASTSTHTTTTTTSPVLMKGGVEIRRVNSGSRNKVSYVTKGGSGDSSVLSHPPGSSNSSVTTLGNGPDAVSLSSVSVVSVGASTINIAGSGEGVVGLLPAVGGVGGGGREGEGQER